MSNSSLIILNYGDDCWKLYGVTEQYHLRSWSPIDKWSNPTECVCENTSGTLANLGSYQGIASIYDYDSKYLNDCGNIYWFNCTDNQMLLL